MQIGCTQMHAVTLTAIVFELVVFGAQGVLYLERPKDRTRLGYLILLLLLLVFNVANGLFPDPAYGIPKYVQHIAVNTTGFMMVSYFPFYFYRFFDLEKLRFLAVYGVPLFLLLPYLAFFLVGLSIHEDIAFTHRYGYIVPTVYALVLLVGIGRAIRFAYRQHRDRHLYLEEIGAYTAFMPWAFLAPVVYFQWGQLIETLFTNLGFLALSVFLLYRSVMLGRAEQRLIEDLELVPYDREAIEKNSRKFGLSNREADVVELICQRFRNREIADKLFISERTVNKHVQNIFYKAEVTEREDLIRLMNQP